MAEGKQTQPPGVQIVMEQDRFGAVPSVYFNGFSLSLSNADIGSLLLLDGRPVGKLNMSYTTAKTLAAMLSDLLNRFEAATSHSVMTTEEVALGLSKFENNAPRE